MNTEQTNTKLSNNLFSIKYIPQELKNEIKLKIKKLNEKINELNDSLSDESFKKTTSFSINDVNQIYVGRGDLCTCGCNGYYYSTDKEADYYSPENVEKYLKKFCQKENIVKHSDRMYGAVTHKYNNGSFDVIYVELKNPAV